jgi:hypothetical protein
MTPLCTTQIELSSQRPIRTDVLICYNLYKEIIHSGATSVPLFSYIFVVMDEGVSF